MCGVTKPRSWKLRQQNILRFGSQWRIHKHKFWTCPPPANFLHFHAVFRKIWTNNKLTSPSLVCCPYFCEIVDSPLKAYVYLKIYMEGEWTHVTCWDNRGIWCCTANWLSILLLGDGIWVNSGNFSLCPFLMQENNFNLVTVSYFLQTRKFKVNNEFQKWQWE